MRARHREALAVVGERLGDASDHRRGLLRVTVEERAELVAAHPVGATGRADRLRHPLGQPREERVARRVPVGVVVALEAVEIEEAQHARRGVAGPLELGREVEDQQAAIAQAGELIGEALYAHPPDHAQVLAEGQGGAEDDRQNRCGRQRDGQRTGPTTNM